MLSDSKQLLVVNGRNKFEDSAVGLVYFAIDHHDAEHDQVKRLGESDILAHVLLDYHSDLGSFALQQNLPRPGRIG